MTYSLMSLPEFNKYAFQWSTEFAARCEVGESRGTPVEGVEAVAFQTAADELLHHAAEVRDTLPDSPIGVELLRKVEALEAAALALRDAAICGAWRWLAEAGIAAFHRARLALRRCKLPATREPAEIVGLDGEVEKPTDVSVYVSAKELLAIYRGEPRIIHQLHERCCQPGPFCCVEHACRHA